MNKSNMFLLKAQDVVPNPWMERKCFPLRGKLVPKNWPQSSSIGVCFSAPAGPHHLA